MQIMSFFSNKLKELRKLYGLKQDDIAEIMGVSRQIISRYETGTQEPTLGAVTTLAKIFNVSVSYFVKSLQPPANGLDYYPYHQMIFAPYILNNQSYLLHYVFPDMSHAEEYALTKHLGTIQFECGLHPLGYDKDNNQHVFCNFIILYNDTGELENAIIHKTINMINFLYIIHKGLHILDTPFDNAYYDTYNKYYLKKEDGNIVNIHFSLATEQIGIIEDDTLTPKECSYIYQNLRFWFSKTKKERLKFAQEYYKMLIKKTLNTPEIESNFKIDISKLLPFKL